MPTVFLQFVACHRLTFYSSLRSVSTISTYIHQLCTVHISDLTIKMFGFMDLFATLTLYDNDLAWYRHEQNARRLSSTVLSETTPSLSESLDAATPRSEAQEKSSQNSDTSNITPSSQNELPASPVASSGSGSKASRTEEGARRQKLALQREKRRVEWLRQHVAGRGMRIDLQEKEISKQKAIVKEQDFQIKQLEEQLASLRVEKTETNSKLNAARGINDLNTTKIQELEGQVLGLQMCNEIHEQKEKIYVNQRQESLNSLTWFQAQNNDLLQNLTRRRLLFAECHDREETEFFNARKEYIAKITDLQNEVEVQQKLIHNFQTRWTTNLVMVEELLPRIEQLHEKIDTHLTNHLGRTQDASKPRASAIERSLTTGFLGTLKEVSTLAVDLISDVSEFRDKTAESMDASSQAVTKTARCAQLTRLYKERLDEAKEEADNLRIELHTEREKTAIFNPVLHAVDELVEALTSHMPRPKATAFFMNRLKPSIQKVVENEQFAAELRQKKVELDRLENKLNGEENRILALQQESTAFLQNTLQAQAYVIEKFMDEGAGAVINRAKAKAWYEQFEQQARENAAARMRVPTRAEALALPVLDYIKHEENRNLVTAMHDIDSLAVEHGGQVDMYWKSNLVENYAGPHHEAHLGYPQDEFDARHQVAQTFSMNGHIDHFVKDMLEPKGGLLEALPSILSYDASRIQQTIAGPSAPILPRFERPVEPLGEDCERSPSPRSRFPIEDILYVPPKHTGKGKGKARADQENPVETADGVCQTLAPASRRVEPNSSSPLDFRESLTSPEGQHQPSTQILQYQAQVPLRPPPGLSFSTGAAQVRAQNQAHGSGSVSTALQFEKPPTPPDQPTAKKRKKMKGKGRVKG